MFSYSTTPAFLSTSPANANYKSFRLISIKAIGHFLNRTLRGFTEGNGERLPLKYYSMKCFTFLEIIQNQLSILDIQSTDLF